MFFLLRFCLGLVLLSPAVVSAQSFLETPANGDKLSGIGVIRGWKCEAGDLTMRFNGGSPIQLPYGSERSDVLEEGACPTSDVGFVAIWNWGNLGDGTHTVAVYDDGEEFASSTFTVTTPGAGFLRDAPNKRVTVEDFPHDGDTAVLEWNTGTQHFEIVEFMSGAPDVVECKVGLRVMKGESCTGTVPVIGINYTFSVNDKGDGCISGTGTPFDDCWAEPALLPPDVTTLGVEATKNADGSWTLDSLPGQ